VVKVDGIQEIDGEYMQLLQTTLASDVDKFFNRNAGEYSIAISGVMLDDGITQCPVNIAEEVIQEVSTTM